MLMRLPPLIRILIVAWVALVSASSPSELLTSAQAQEEQEQQSASILFTAIDSNKNLLTSLRKEDISVLEDGVPQEVMTFRQRTHEPLSLAILIDTSVSQERALPAQKEAATLFVDSVMRQGKDRAAIISFTSDAILKQNLTDDVAIAREAIKSIKFEPPKGYPGIGKIISPSDISKLRLPDRRAGATAIWDSIWAACDQVLDKAPGETRRAIILLTDGNDTTSRKDINEAVERAIKSDVVIYSIGIGDPAIGGLNKSSLERVSERTGGRAFFPKRDKDLGLAFTSIEQTLRSQYMVSYTSKSKRRSDSLRKVRIEIANPELRKQKLQLFHQQGYFAK